MHPVIFSADRYKKSPRNPLNFWGSETRGLTDRMTWLSRGSHSNQWKNRSKTGKKSKRSTLP